MHLNSRITFVLVFFGFLVFWLKYDALDRRHQHTCNIWAGRVGVFGGQVPLSTNLDHELIIRKVQNHSQLITIS